MERAFVVVAALGAACSPAPGPSESPRPDMSALFVQPAPPATEDADAGASGESADADAGADASAGAGEAACRADGDCGYDPVGRRCGTDPRFNKQPPLIDQGIVCYCEEGSASCALLRVDPAPCEGDTSCAVRLDPRPHPIRADAAHPYQKPGRCGRIRAGMPRRTDRYVTCERTNICTMHTRECGQP